MQVVVTLEHRFDQTPEGAVWTYTQFPYGFWTRYLEVFDQVRVVARIREVPAVSGEAKRADGANVAFAPVPYYLGPWQYLLRARQVTRAVRQAVQPEDAVIMRVGSRLGTCLAPLLYRTGHPYGVEVVGDPYDVFAPGAVRHPLRPFFRWWSPRQLRRQCAGACAAAYVSEHALQRRYPAAPHAFTTHYSSIELPGDAIVDGPRNGHVAKPISLVSVGTLAQLYKAPDVLIDAVALCVEQGLDLQAVWLGDGKHKAELEEYAAQRGVAEQVGFVGQVPAGEAVRARLDEADLFVLPSRQEGLPRAMVEAMARALPCIGSTVGGIPELLPAEDLVRAGDAKALAQKIKEVVTDPQRMARMSARNLAQAREYRDDVLRERRVAFYQYVQDRTAEWLKERARRQQFS